MKGLPAILAAVVAALAAGCGGAGAEPVPPVSEDGRLSRPELVRRANEICARSEAAVALATRRGREAIEAGKVSGSRDEVADAVLTGAKVVEPYQRRLRALEPPRTDAPEWDRFLDRLEGATDLLPLLRGRSGRATGRG